MKKSIVVVLGLVFLLLTGCGKAQTEDNINFNEFANIDSYEQAVAASHPELLDMNKETPGTVLKYYFQAMSHNEIRAALQLTSTYELSFWRLSNFDMEKHIRTFKEQLGLPEKIEVVDERLRDQEVAIVKIKLPPLHKGGRPVIGDYEIRKKQGFWKVEGWLKDNDKRGRQILEVKGDLLNNLNDLNMVEKIASRGFKERLGKQGLTFEQYLSPYFEDYYNSSSRYEVQDGENAYIMLVIKHKDSVKHPDSEVFLKIIKENDEWKLDSVEKG